METVTCIVSNERILGGTPVVLGTRVPADNILAEVRAGKTKFDIFRSYPLLPLDGVEVCIEWDRAGRPALNDPFLINECLSLDVVALAHARGHHATHVVFRKRQGTSDPDLMPLIRAEGFAPVTNNARDFLTLYAEEEVHPGLVIIVPGGIVRETQIKLFSRVLDVIAPMADLIDRVVEVFIDERVEVREWPRTV